MHSFTIALISTLSLGVHAASIGDSVSQPVTREQHNSLFHNPDFTSANLPAAESFEPAGKISPRKAAVDAFLNGNIAFDHTASELNTANSQGVPIIPSGNFLSGNILANTANAHALTASLGSNAAPAINMFTNGGQVVTQAATNVDAQAALDIQTSIRLEAALIVEATQTLARVRDVAISLTADNVLALVGSVMVSLDEVTRVLVALNVVSGQVAKAINAAAVSSCLGFSANVGAKRDSQQDSQQDVVKRQNLPVTGLAGVTDAAKNTVLNNTTNAPVVTREDNTKFFDDEVEDMDFSEADGLEEGF